MMNPDSLTGKLNQCVSRRWAEIARFALDHCADGYDRGYVLLDGPDDDLCYVSVPNRKGTMSEMMKPWTLEEAVMVKENCDEFIVVVLKDGESLVWGIFPEVEGVSMRQAAGIL